MLFSVNMNSETHRSEKKLKEYANMMSFVKGLLVLLK